ncbi:MAG TPA: cobalamin-binding protein [Thermoleophilia bacterium]|nr:cobalamin-binding protein [Thermoleophilia bacterium]
MPAPVSRRSPGHRLTALTVPLAIAAVLAAVFLLGACGSGGSTSSSSSPAAAASSGPITVTDDAGQQVTLDQPAARVVSIAPANTEIAFAIGAGDKVVAGTSYDDYPAQAKSLPKIGDFQSPSVEKIVSFKPDLVLATLGIQAGLRTKLEKLGVKVYAVDPATLDKTYADLTNLGRLLGVSDKADALVAQMKQRAQAVTDKTASAQSAKVFVEIYSKPLMTAGKGTLISDLVKLAGGSNIGDGAGTGFPAYNSEVLLQQDPDVYIATTGSMQTPGQIAKRQGYSALTAVKDGRVYVVEDNLIVRPGPRLIDGLEQLARMIHPELFGSPSPAASASPAQ